MPDDNVSPSRARDCLGASTHLHTKMKIGFISVVSMMVIMASNGWCQPPLPSGPGDTLKRSQETREYYRLEQKIEQDRQRLEKKNAEPEQKTGNQDEIEINAEDDQVIHYRDQTKPEKEK